MVLKLGLGGRQHASDFGFQFRLAFLHALITRNCPGWATAGFGEKILSTEETGSDSSIG